MKTPAFAQKSKTKTLAGMAINVEDRTNGNELPLSTQFTALFALWSVWLLAILGVIWKESKLRGEGSYANPFLVYSIALAGLPLVLVALGLVFLQRQQGIASLRSVRGFLYWVVLGLTLFGGGVFAVYGRGL